MWYKFTYSYGGGHQGSATHYQWYDYRLKGSSKESEWEGIADKNGYRNACGNCTWVKRPPQKELDRKIQRCKERIKHLKEMIKLFQEAG